jgi:hypothetical protein
MIPKSEFFNFFVFDQLYLYYVFKCMNIIKQDNYLQKNIIVGLFKAFFPSILANFWSEISLFGPTLAFISMFVTIISIINQQLAYLVIEKHTP